MTSVRESNLVKGAHRVKRGGEFHPVSVKKPRARLRTEQMTRAHLTEQRTFAISNDIFSLHTLPSVKNQLEAAMSSEAPSTTQASASAALTDAAFDNAVMEQVRFGTNLSRSVSSQDGLTSCDVRQHMISIKKRDITKVRAENLCSFHSCSC